MRYTTCRRGHLRQHEFSPLSDVDTSWNGDCAKLFQDRSTLAWDQRTSLLLGCLAQSRCSSRRQCLSVTRLSPARTLVTVNPFVRSILSISPFFPKQPTSSRIASHMSSSLAHDRHHHTAMEHSLSVLLALYSDRSHLSPLMIFQRRRKLWCPYC